VSNLKARSPESRPDAPKSAAQIEQLKLVFASDLAKVPRAQRDELAKALTRLAEPGSARWRIWASAQESDERAKRTTFELMASVRNVMARKGFDESTIDLRLQLQRLAPADSAPGEIVIFVAPILEKGSAGSGS
jgi:plasmid replication initiation protein